MPKMKPAEVRADLKKILGSVKELNAAIKTTGFFNLTEIRKTLNNENITSENFNFIEFIHSAEFDPVLHIKKSRQLHKDVWLSLANTFHRDDLESHNINELLFTELKNLPYIRKAIMLQAACMELEKRYMEKFNNEILELYADPTVANLRPSELYDQLGINITSNKNILGHALAELLSHLQKTLVKEKFATDYSKSNPFKAKHIARADHALLDLHNVLTDRDRMNHAIVSFDILDKIGKDTEIPGLPNDSTKEQKLNFDWLQFIYSSEFNPEKHLGDQVGRIWSALSNAFTVEDLKSIGLQKEAFNLDANDQFDWNQAIDQIRFGILFYAASATIESGYRFEDLEDAQYVSDLKANEAANANMMDSLRKAATQVITKGKALMNKCDTAFMMIDRADVVERDRASQKLNEKLQLPLIWQNQIIVMINDLYNDTDNFKVETNPMLKLINATNTEKNLAKLDTLNDLYNCLNIIKAVPIIENILTNNPDIVDKKMYKLFDSIINASEELIKVNAAEADTISKQDLVVHIEKRLSNPNTVNRAIGDLEMINLDKVPEFTKQCERRYSEIFVKNANDLKLEIQALNNQFERITNSEERERFNAEIDNLLNRYGFINLLLDISEKTDANLRKQAAHDVTKDFQFLDFMLAKDSKFDPEIHFKTNYHRAFNFLSECFSEKSMTDLGFMHNGEPVALLPENKPIICKMIMLAAVTQLFEHETLEKAKPQIDAVMRNLKNPAIPSEKQREMLHAVTRLGQPISGVNKQFDSALPHWMAAIEKCIQAELQSHKKYESGYGGMFAHAKTAKPTGLESNNNSNNTSPTITPRLNNDD